MQKTIIYKAAVISYLRWGKGEQLAFCFHGFGETAQLFSILNEGIANFTFIAPDLPFHGNTIWPDALEVLPEDLYKIINAIKDEEGFTNINQYNLMGYSLGGRLALSLYENYPATINKLVLIAPDGLKTNFWYFMATQTKPGNNIFKWTMNHPYWFLKMTAYLQKKHLINPSISKFVQLYLHDEKARQQLYTIWTGFRKFKPHTKKIKQLIEQHHTPLRLIYGRYDKIMPYKTGKKFIEGLGEGTMILIESGHQLLAKKYYKEITGAITN